MVLSTGSKLLLTCSGDVTVDGVKVRNSSNTKRTASSSSATSATVTITSHTEVSIKSDKHTTENAVSERYHSNSTEAGENRSLRPTDTGHTASPTTHTVQPTSVHRLLKEELDGESDYEEEEEEEVEREVGSRVTRGIKLRPQWKRDGKTVGKGDTDFEGITFERRGAALSLSSARLTDSGEYTCHFRDRRRFSLKVIVAGESQRQ